MDLNPNLNLSVGSLSNLSYSRSQEFILEESSQENLCESTPSRVVKKYKMSTNDAKYSSMASSLSSLSSNVTKYIIILMINIKIQSNKSLIL